VTRPRALVLAFLTTACARPAPVPTSDAARDATPPAAATPSAEDSGPADAYAREDLEKTGSNVQPASLSEGVRAACVGRGAYTWSGSRYVRDLDAGEGPWRPLACRGLW
jgi:hypothetical protein